MTISHEALNHLYDEAKFIVTCSNVIDESGHLPNNIVSSYIKDIDGVKILFVAATAPFTPFYRALDWIVTDPLDSIKEEIELQRGKFDVLIVLSHCGIFFDETLCQELPEIDVIFGSHTHHYFEHGEINNGVLMAAAGKYGNYLGEVNLTFEAHKVVHKTAKIIPLETLPEVKTSFEEEGKTLMSNPVIQHPVVLKRSMNHITEAAYLLAQSVCEYTHAQCAIINAGLLVKDIVKDEVTEYDIHQMLPHPINMVRVRLSGVKLKEIIAKSNKQEYMYEHAQGLGFRGNIFGGYILYNLGYIHSTGRYYLNGEEIEDDKEYVLGTIDMYTFGRYFPTLKELPKEYLMPEFLRDIFKEKLLEY
ncbi:5'-nucleotidase family protein [Staphylococcus aureus subsp. aureus 112808A]|nr:5'-nucleotidase family protein [Staphylococcus aureus subsp. aureus 112808A]